MKVRISQEELDEYKQPDGDGNYRYVFPYNDGKGIEFEGEKSNSFEEKILNELDGNEYRSMKSILQESRTCLGRIVDLLEKEHNCARCGKIMQIQQ